MVRAPAGSEQRGPAGLNARARRFQERNDFWPLVTLAALLAIGAVLRLWLTAAYHPAIVGFPDSATYLHVASSGAGPVGDPLHPVGYPVFLEALHALGASLTATVLVQHLLGLAAAVLLYLTVRRAGAPAWFALLPPFVLLLCGDEIFIEHAVLSEPLFIFLACAALYCTVRADDGSQRRAWATLAGLLAGGATTVRTIGLVLVPVVVLWLILRRPVGPGWPAWRRTLAPGLLAALSSLIIVLGYAGWHDHSAGGFGLTSNSAFILYGRVAPWANCQDFTPPAGTAGLCQLTPASRRPGAGVYIFAASPGTELFGPPGRPLSPASAAKLRSFALAAIEHQPLTYLWTVVEKLLRVVSPGAGTPGEGQTPSTFLPYMSDLGRSAGAMPIVRSMYGNRTRLVIHSSIAALAAYDSRTHADGLFMALLIVLAIAAPFLAPGGGPRRRAVLLTVFALALLITPLATVDYDYRYVIPALGPLAAAAAIGAWELWRVIMARGGPRRTLEPAPAATKPAS